MGLHLRSRRLQSCSAAEASGGLGLKAPANCRLIGRWRIVESDLWDRAHLDLSGPATLIITAQGGEIAFGALEGGLEVEYARDSIGFLWAGCEEGDEVEGEGTAELLDDGTIEIKFAYQNGLCNRGLLADCDFNRAALHPAYPIKCRTSTQRTQAPESVDTPKSLSPLDPIENAIRKKRSFPDIWRQTKLDPQPWLAMMPTEVARLTTGSGVRSLQKREHAAALSPRRSMRLEGRLEIPCD